MIRISFHEYGIRKHRNKIPQNHEPYKASIGFIYIKNERIMIVIGTTRKEMGLKQLKRKVPSTKLVSLFMMWMALNGLRNFQQLRIITRASI